jgi:hypothetical protein
MAPPLWTSCGGGKPPVIILQQSCRGRASPLRGSSGGFTLSYWRSTHLFCVGVTGWVRFVTTEDLWRRLISLHACAVQARLRQAGRSHRLIDWRYRYGVGAAAFAQCAGLSGGRRDGGSLKCFSSTGKGCPVPKQHRPRKHEEISARLARKLLRVDAQATPRGASWLSACRRTRAAIFLQQLLLHIVRRLRLGRLQALILPSGCSMPCGGVVGTGRYPALCGCAGAACDLRSGSRFRRGDPGCAPSGRRWPGTSVRRRRWQTSNTAVFKETADDRTHANVLRNTGNARTQGNRCRERSVRSSRPRCWPCTARGSSSHRSAR